MKKKSKAGLAAPSRKTGKAAKGNTVTLSDKFTKTTLLVNAAGLSPAKQERLREKAQKHGEKTYGRSKFVLCVVTNAEKLGTLKHRPKHVVFEPG